MVGAAGGSALLAGHPEAGEARRGTSQAVKCLRNIKSAYVISMLIPVCVPRVASVRSLAVCAARDDGAYLFVRDREEMDEERDVVAGAEGMFAVRKNFDLAEEAREQRVQTRAREKVFVIAFEQMPGNNPPVVEIRKQFEVWNREEGATPNNAGDFAGECFGIFRVLEDFDANGAIEFAVTGR